MAIDSTSRFKEIATPDTPATDRHYLYTGTDGKLKKVDDTGTVTTYGAEFTTEDAQDAVGAMVDSTLVYTDGTPLLSRAALTGDVTASAGSNTTTIANDAVTNAKMANAAAWTVKMRNAGSSGDLSDAALADITEEASPAAGDFLLGFLDSGEIRKFDIDNLPSGGGSSNSFETINCPAGTDPVADSSTDTLNLTTSDSHLVITGNSGTDTIDFTIASTVVTTTGSQTLTNKTIDADSNTITNIENADIKAAAAIAVNKLAAITASRAVVSDGSGFISAATTTATEIGYVNGVTSAIQTQLNAKAATALSNLASVAINTSLISDTDNTDDLGSSSIKWKDLYLAGESYNSDGDATTPSVTFSADTNTGMYRIGADTIGFACNGAEEFRIATDGVTAEAYFHSSDERLKKNIKPAPGVSLIRKLEGKSFLWRNTGQKDYGVIAQQIEEILPELVSGSDDSKTVKYSSLIAILIESVKELDSRLKKLEKK